MNSVVERKQRYESVRRYEKARMALYDAEREQYAREQEIIATAELRCCPICSYDAIPPKKQDGRWVIDCSSSHCCISASMIADDWEQCVCEELNPHIAIDLLYRSRLTELIYNWNRRSK